MKNKNHSASVDYIRNIIKVFILKPIQNPDNFI